MPGPEECFESKQALNARFRESNRNISPIEKDYHTNLKECKNDILFIAYYISCHCSFPVYLSIGAYQLHGTHVIIKERRTHSVVPVLLDMQVVPGRVNQDRKDAAGIAGKISCSRGDN